MMLYTHDSYHIINSLIYFRIQVNSANLENADHLEAVEALKAAGNNIHMVVTREVLVSSETMFQEPPSPTVEVSTDEPGVSMGMGWCIMQKRGEPQVCLLAAGNVFIPSGQ